MVKSLCFLTLLACLSGAIADRRATCARIASEVSLASQVFYPGSVEYTDDINHATGSSTQASVCSVEPGTARDVGIILSILGQTKDAFAVKGGGHAYNQNFSSTTGIQIAMKRLNSVNYDEPTKTVSIGAGSIWDDVYDVLNPLGVNVAGGRVSGIGVAGFTLGGGYSWFTNQYGLTIDTAIAFELVKPSGEIVTVTNDSDTDLFFSLKGGYNNFGIVTKFTLRAFPQGSIWAGIGYYDGISSGTNIISAIVKFVETVKDPKAGIIPSFAFAGGQHIITLSLFYDGSAPPPGVFDDFLAIPPLPFPPSNYGTRSFADFIHSFPDLQQVQSIHTTVPFSATTANILRALQNETLFWGPKLFALDPTAVVIYSPEPFLPTILSHGPPSAYPPSRRVAFLPSSIEFDWSLPTVSRFAKTGIVATTLALYKAAAKDGQNIEGATPYGNYANTYTPDVAIFGPSLLRMCAVKRRVDPGNTMGQTGGWKVC